jgi:hypothetical protein
MLFAVAYVVEEFPRYDHVKTEGQTVHYYFEGKEVYTFDWSAYDNKARWAVSFPKHLVIDYVDVGSPEEACKKVTDKCQFHILMIAVSAVPGR